VSRSGTFGVEGAAEVDADLTGRVRAIGRTMRIDRSVNVTIEAGAIQMLDGSQADEVLDRLTTRIGQKMLMGGSQLADNEVAVAG
jgi:hypothetical protein